MHPLVTEHLGEIQLLSEKYGVERLEIFGSAMTDEFDPERSDVDFIVHYPAGYDFGHFLSRFQDFEDELAIALGRPAQLVMTSALRNARFSKNADKTRMTVYASATNSRQSERHQETMPTHR